MSERAEEIRRRFADDLVTLEARPYLRDKNGSDDYEGWQDVAAIADLLAALAQAEHERDEQAAKHADCCVDRQELAEARAEVERLKNESVAQRQRTASLVANTEADLARVRGALEKTVAALLHVSVTSSRYRSHAMGCQAHCTCDAIMDDKLVKAEISRVVQPVLDVARAALEGRSE